MLARLRSVRREARLRARRLRVSNGVGSRSGSRPADANAQGRGGFVEEAMTEDSCIQAPREGGGSCGWAGKGEGSGRGEGREKSD
jgi:hypothetical protein